MIEEAIEFYSSNIGGYPLFYAIYFSFIASIGYIAGGLRSQYIISTLYIVLFVILFNSMMINTHVLKSVYLYPFYAVFFLTGLHCRTGFFSSLSFPFFGFISSIFEALREAIGRFRASRNTNTRSEAEKRSQGERKSRREKKHSEAKNKGSSQDSDSRNQEAREEFRQARAEREQEQAETNAQKSQGKPERSPLEVLGLSADFTPAELEKAYRRRAKLYHPDGVEHLNDKGITKEMNDKFVEVKEAYKKLKPNL